MSQDWRTIQVFLSPRLTGVWETQIDLKNSSNVRCSCTAFKAKNECKHSKFVTARAKNNGGVYPLMVSPETTDEEAEAAQRSPEDFRAFVLKRGKIEVL